MYFYHRTLGVEITQAFSKIRVDHFNDKIVTKFEQQQLQSNPYFQNMKSFYSKELYIVSCFNTLVWLVSLISPARNISSTTVYTLQKLNTRSSSHTLWKYSFNTSTKLCMASRQYRLLSLTSTQMQKQRPAQRRQMILKLRNSTKLVCFWSRTVTTEKGRKG